MHNLPNVFVHDFFMDHKYQSKGSTLGKALSSEESIGDIGTFWWGVAQGMETLQIQWEGKFQHLPKVTES